MDLRGVNKAIALGLLNAITQGDIDRCAALFHLDAVWWVQGWGEMRASCFLKSLGGTIARSSSRSIEVGLVTAEDGRVSVQAKGQFVFADGVYANSYHYLFEITDGKIARGFEYLDTSIASAFFKGPARSATTRTSPDPKGDAN